jgi:outer membrane protein assembly factor BamD
VPYALWRVGRSYFEQIPSDFFILPPVHERDPAATKDALRALGTFVDRYPDHEQTPDARERILACRRLLADQELYVARFYMRQDRPVSARGRLEGIVAQYADLPDRWSEAALLGSCASTSRSRRPRRPPRRTSSTRRRGRWLRG